MPPAVPAGETGACPNCPTSPPPNWPPHAAAHALDAYREVAPHLLGEGVEGRILEVYLNRAFRRLSWAPTSREGWNARPGGVLAHLLRFAVDTLEEWRGWLRE